MAIERMDSSSSSYVDLPAIIAGTILALAISLVFLQFGSAIGLSISAKTEWEEGSAFGRMLATGLWILWIQILASLAGGYLAGRMRRPVAGGAEHEREMRDGMHGLLVWASGTIAVAVGAAIAAALASLAPETAAAAERTEALIRLEENAAIIIAFTAAATSFISAVAAWWAATMGGEHRDNAIDHSRYVSFRRAKR